MFFRETKALAAVEVSVEEVTNALSPWAGQPRAAGWKSEYVFRHSGPEIIAVIVNVL